MLTDAALAPISPGASLFADAPGTTEFNKLRKRLTRNVSTAIADFAMARAGERWLVGVSGGKDSYALLAILHDLKERDALPVDLLACNLDQAQPNFPVDVLPDFFAQHAIPYRIDRRDTYSVVTRTIPAGKTYCSLCSRLRRGNLYRIAREEGCSALVLGHHREDILETFFLNMFFGGQLAAMPAKLINDEGDIEVLRPMAYCAESDLAKFSAALKFPIIPCDLCGSQEGLQRNNMKNMLTEMEQKMPGRKQTMLRALMNVKPRHLLDKKLLAPEAE